MMDQIDSVIKKANRLVELLREAQQIINSLSGFREYNVLLNFVADRDSDDVIDKDINSGKIDTSVS